MALKRNGMERLWRSNKVLSLHELCCHAIVARTNVYGIDRLPLPDAIKANLGTVREELEQANRDNLPLVRRMLEEVASDAAALHMDKEDLMADFMTSYQEALTEIGFTSREIAKLATAALLG